MGNTGNVAWIPASLAGPRARPRDPDRIPHLDAMSSYLTTNFPLNTFIQLSIVSYSHASAGPVQTAVTQNQRIFTVIGVVCVKNMSGHQSGYLL